MWGKRNNDSGQEPENSISEELEALNTARASIAELIAAVHRISNGFNINSIGDESDRDKMSFRFEFLRDEARRAALENGLQVPDLLGVVLGPSVSVTIENGEEFTPQDKLVVVTVLEPLITFGVHTLKQGRVIAAREQNGVQE